MVTKEQMFEDLGSEPDEDRGVPLRQPILEEKPEEEVVETQEETAEGQTEPEEVPEQTEEEVQAEGQFEPRFFNDFVKDTGWTLEEGYRDIYLKDQEGNPIPIGETMDVINNQRTEIETLRNERQQLEAKAVQAPVQQYAPEAVDLWNKANYLQQSYDNTDWSQVSAEQRVDLKLQYRDEIEKLRSEAQKVQGEHQIKVEEAMRQFQAEVKTQMVKEIPEWRSERVKTEEKEGLGSYLLSEGAERQTVDQILDHNPWAARMFRKLWQYEKANAETKKAVKKVQKVPRSMKPGGHQPVKKPSLAEVADFVNKAPSRRIRDKRLLEADFDDSLLPK